MASVIGHIQGKAGISNLVAPEEIGRVILSKGARGALGVDLLHYASGMGYSAIQKSGTIEDLRKSVDEGNPVIILTDLGIGPYQRNHFMVVVGYSQNGVIVHSSGHRLYIPEEDLARTWSRAGNWMLTVK